VTRVVGPNTTNRFPITKDEREYTVPNLHDQQLARARAWSTGQQLRLDLRRALQPVEHRQHPRFGRASP
jgi:hypothetical protein